MPFTLFLRCLQLWCIVLHCTVFSSATSLGRLCHGKSHFRVVVLKSWKVMEALSSSSFFLSRLGWDWAGWRCEGFLIFWKWVEMASDSLQLLYQEVGCLLPPLQVWGSFLLTSRMRHCEPSSQDLQTFCSFHSYTLRILRPPFLRSLGMRNHVEREASHPHHPSISTKASDGWVRPSGHSAHNCCCCMNELGQDQQKYPVTPTVKYYIIVALGHRDWGRLLFSRSWLTQWSWDVPTSEAQLL